MHVTGNENRLPVSQDHSLSLHVPVVIFGSHSINCHYKELLFEFRINLVNSFYDRTIRIT